MQLKPLIISGKEVSPLVEGGKGISISTGQSSGAWAATGAVGTFSAVNADAHDDNGNLIPVVYKGRTRLERHHELMEYAIRGGITQARIANDMRGSEGRLHVNVLWEMGACEQILEGVLSGAKGLIHGVTCGAGMPYKLSTIAASHGVYYYPIVSSARAFRALWLRSYHKSSQWLGGVVYEDPWLAGGHNGLSNGEDPKAPEDPYPRVAVLRKVMNSFGLENVPIIMAGGVWSLNEWSHWIDNPEIGPIAFQFGTRPLLTKESPISDAWKRRLFELKEGEILLNRFSPTGFYSSAARNLFMQNLEQRSQRQIAYQTKPVGDHNAELGIGPRKRLVYLTAHDKQSALTWINQGYTEAMRTPDSTLVFVKPDEALQIHQDQVDCMGCLSACNFSNWAQNEEGTTGRKADPRSFCIQKTLQTISHSDDIDHQLMFAGHGAYRFGSDPFYANGFIPTVKELVERIKTGQ